MFFPNTNNRGGVCYFISDYEKIDSEVKVVTHQNNSIISNKKRSLMVKNIDIFIRDSMAISVINKVFKTKNEGDLSSIVSPRKPFGIESNIIKNSKFKSASTELTNPVVCIGKNRIKGYLERDDIKANQEWIDKWKVYVPRANNIGTELNDDNLNSFVGEPNSICTESYIVVGACMDMDAEEAKNLCKYLTSKFVRYLHKQAKASQDASSKTYKFIPLQNFTHNSDIDWTKPIANMDEQFFDKYNLSEEEKEHIKNSIKDMEV